MTMSVTNVKKRAVRCLSAAAFLATVCACGNAVTTSVKGEVGLTRGANGHLTALIATCDSRVSTLDVAGSREGLAESDVNPQLGTYVAAKPVTGTVRLDLESDNPGWTTTRRLSMPKAPTKSIIVTAVNRDEDSQTSQTTATRAQLDALTPGKVLRSDGSTVSEKTFTDASCG